MSDEEPAPLTEDERGAGAVVLFLILMAAAGAVASQFLTWIFATLVGFLILPLYVCAMLLSGTGVLKALFVGLLGFAILQASYVLTGWVLEIVRARSAPWRMNRAAFQPARNDRNPLRTEWPLIGGWLPLLAFYDPPCRRPAGPTAHPGTASTTPATAPPCWPSAGSAMRSASSAPPRGGSRRYPRLRRRR